jgi:hypothetical protein
MSTLPAHNDLCSDCGAEIEPHYGDVRCPTCFDNHLYAIDAGFLESYRRFGCRSRLIVAESCLRSLVLESPDHRKVLAMTIFEQYVQAMADLAGLFVAFQKRHEAPILRTFMEFRLDAPSATAFFETIRNTSNPELCAMLDVPMPGYVSALCPHLSEEEAYAVSVAVHHLMLDLRKATEHGELGALALAQMLQQVGGAIIAPDARWLNGDGKHLNPDEVAMLVLDSKRRSFYVQGLTADEGAMGQVVDAVDTVTRAASNLIFAYLQTKDL